MHLPSLDDIRRLLNAREPERIDDPSRTRAAVALILRVTPAGMEMLLIERARHDTDPWAGNLGFPGGKMEIIDRDERSAAVRETREEIGLEMETARGLGRLSDIAGAHLPVTVSCFVFALSRQAPSPRTGGEVRAVFWVPLSVLLDPARHRYEQVRFSGKELSVPAIRLPEPGHTVLWGITYRLVMQFLGIIVPSRLPPPSFPDVLSPLHQK